VTGPNGAGKTSLLRVLAGRVWPDPGPRGGTRRYFFSRRASSTPLGHPGAIAWFSPEMHQRFARLDAPLTAGEAICTGFAGTLLLTERPTPAQRASARRVARRLGLETLWQRPFAELSQGQQRLVLLARALAPQPRLLVLDEFSDGLDNAARARATTALAAMRRAGTAVVVATHRASDALPGLTHGLVLRGGRARVESVRDVRPKVSAPARAVAPRVARKPAKVSHNLAPAAPPTLRLVRASVAVGDHRRVRRILHEIDWIVRPGEHWAVLGPNGSGKSTLLRAIYGELPVARGGLLERFGCDGRALPLPAARRWLGYVSPALQHHYAADATVAAVVASGFQASIGLARPPRPVELATAGATLRRLRAGSLAPRPWGELSFGEARLALLARALVHRPRLLLLDEPADGLAPAARARFLRAVERAARAGAQIIVAAHRPEDLPACVNRTLRLAGGRVTG
jgi:molybdate transport system ATP-binding protein